MRMGAQIFLSQSVGTLKRTVMSRGWCQNLRTQSLWYQKKVILILANYQSRHVAMATECAR